MCGFFFVCLCFVFFNFIYRPKEQLILIHFEGMYLDSGAPLTIRVHLIV